MAAINFLPTEQIRSQQAINASNKLKYFGIVLAFVCLVVGIGGAGFIFYKNSNINKLTLEEDSLKAQVLASESTEQTLVLFRDRLSKLQRIFSKYTANNVLIDELALFNSFPPEAQLTKLELNQNDSNFTVTVPNSAILQNVIEMTQLSGLPNASIHTLSFNNTLGFEANVTSK